MDTVKALQFYKILQQASLILVSILFTKVGLSTAEIGMYELLFFVGSVFTFFWVNGILQGMLPIYAELNEEEKRSFISTNYVLFLLAAVLIFLFLFFGQNFVVPFLTGHDTLPHFTLFLIFLSINLPTYLIEDIYLLQKKPAQIIGWGLFSFLGYIIVVMAPLLIGYGLQYSFIGLISLAIAKHIWSLFIVLKNSSLKWSNPIASKILGVSTPLILYAFIGGFPILFDKWLVSWWYQDQSMFAIFSYGARELPLATAMAAGLSAAMIPQVSENLKEGLAQLKIKSTNLMHLIFPIGIVLLLINKWLFPIVFNSDFADSATIFNVYLLILISRLIFPQTVLIAKKLTQPMLVISVIELGINVILSLILIKSFGLVGVAFATFVAYLFEKIAIAFVVRSRFGISFSEYTDVKWLCVYGVGLVIAFIVSIPLF